MIWLIGKNGMLGSEIANQLASQNIPFVATGHEVDITNVAAIKKFLSSAENNFSTNNNIDSNIKWIINCAAYTAVEKAETEIEAAHALNAYAPKNLARAAKKIGATLIHFSTDYVFGKLSVNDSSTGKTFPFCEDDAKHPLGIYGLTKSEGEDAIQSETENYYILRTAWLYGFYGKNFVYTMTRLMSERDKIKVVCDQHGTPTNAADLAEATITLILKSEKSDTIPPYGIYHFTNEGNTTWFDFAKEIYTLGKKYKRIENKCEIVPCTTEEYGAKVERPKYSVLSKEKISQELKIKIPDWRESLENFMADSRFEPK